MNAQRIIKAVADQFDVPPSVIRGRSRQNHLVQARRMIWHIMVNRYGYGTRAAARAVNRTHGACSKGLASLREEIFRSANMRNAFDERLEKSLEAIEFNRSE